MGHAGKKRGGLQAAWANEVTSLILAEVQTKKPSLFGVANSDEATFRKCDVIGDGNCFYRCVSKAFYGNEGKFEDIKEFFIEFLEEINEDEITMMQTIIPSDDKEMNTKYFQDWAKRLAKSKNGLSTYFERPDIFGYAFNKSNPEVRVIVLNPMLYPDNSGKEGDYRYVLKLKKAFDSSLFYQEQGGVNQNWNQSIIIYYNGVPDFKRCSHYDLMKDY